MIDIVYIISSNFLIFAIFVFLILLSISVIYMKIKKGGKPPKNPRTVYGCGECGEYFTSPDILKQHCKIEHDIVLSDTDSKKLPYDVTSDKYQQMQADEASNVLVTEHEAVEAAERSDTKLSQPVSTDPDNLLNISDDMDPNSVYKYLKSVLESPVGSQPLPGIFKIDIKKDKIQLVVALELQNTPSNMEAISTFNSSIK